MKKLRIVVKIGSNVLTRKDGTLDVTRMSSIVDQVCELRCRRIEVILVSSGAVVAGKAVLKSTVANRKIDIVAGRQLYAAVGQVGLMIHYHSLFRDNGVNCGQVLATKDDFATRRHYLNQRNCVQVMLENGVVPIMNENDAISVNELMFTDNDELSGLVATMMNADKLIILSNIDGIYDGNPSLETSSVIREIKTGIDNIEDFIQTSKSSAGRGGMITKYNTACKVSREGVEVVIANGKTENMLLKLIGDPEGCVFTRFVPMRKKVSSVKKWIAHSEGFAKGEIYVNDHARDALLSDKAISLLPVGVTDIRGDFESDDIVRIIGPEGTLLGVGKSSYGSDEARAIMGQKHNKPIIHYDYLYIER